MNPLLREVLISTDGTGDRNISLLSLLGCQTFTSLMSQLQPRDKTSEMEFIPFMGGWEMHKMCDR